MTTRRVRLTLKLDVDIDPVAVQAGALGAMSRTQAIDEQETIPADKLDRIAHGISGQLVDSIQLQVFVGGVWRTVAASLPSAEIVQNSAHVQVELDPSTLP
jgi:hypothetical protein